MMQQPPTPVRRVTLTPEQKAAVSEVRLVRVEVVAYFDVRDQDGDPLLPPVRKTLVATGKEIGELQPALAAQAEAVKAQLLAE